MRFMKKIQSGNPFSSWRRLPCVLCAAGLATGTVLVLSLGAGTALADRPDTAGIGAQLPAAEELLTRSIAYHDPEGTWSTRAHELTLSGTRPNGPDRESRVVIDNTDGSFTWYRTLADGSELEARVVGEGCLTLLDGAMPTADQIREHDIGCTSLLRMRNYHIYLYGLPMKLRDPGTMLHPDAQQTTFQDRDVYALKVSYDPEVGTDTWYFYLDSETYALVGYRFYHDESINDGEYITLDDEASSGSIRIPKIRAWYTNGDDRHLGTDTVVSIETRFP